MINKGPYVIKAKTPDIAWLKVIELLLVEKEAFNVVVRIEEPPSMTTQLTNLYADFDAFCDKYGKQLKMLSLHHVIYTIFPNTLYKKNCKNKEQKLYSKYMELYPTIKRRSGNKWGTYFYRLINWDFSKKGTINQLEEIIKRIKERRSAYKSAYVMTIVSPCSNLGRHMGAPCLNYIALQIEPENRSISLLAVYRNHYFVKRALGNYLGLSYLLEFICKKSNYTVGELTIISSHAELDANVKQKTFLKGLVEKYDTL